MKINLIFHEIFPLKTKKGHFLFKQNEIYFAESSLTITEKEAESISLYRVTCRKKKYFTTHFLNHPIFRNNITK